MVDGQYKRFIARPRKGARVGQPVLVPPRRSNVNLKLAPSHIHGLVFLEDRSLEVKSECLVSFGAVDEHTAKVIKRQVQAHSTDVDRRLLQHIALDDSDKTINIRLPGPYTSHLSENIVGVPRGHHGTVVLLAVG